MVGWFGLLALRRFPARALAAVLRAGDGPEAVWRRGLLGCEPWGVLQTPGRLQQLLDQRHAAPGARHCRREAAAVEGRKTRWVILSRGERQAREAMNEGIGGILRC